MLASALGRRAAANAFRPCKNLVQRPTSASPSGAASMGNRGSKSQRGTATHASAASISVPKDTKQAYEQLTDLLKETSALEGVRGLLGWDEMTMMPPGAADSRGAQKSALAGVLHDRNTDPKIGALLEVLHKAPKGTLNDVQLAVVRDAARDYKKSTALPKDLAQRIAKLESDAYGAWVKARQASDFSIFAPYLQQWIDVLKEKAKLIDPTKPVYDVLLDDFERGCSVKRLDEIFGKVREALPPLIASIKARGRPLSDEWMKGEYDTEQQAAMCKKVALDLGFDLDKGRLDVSVHPFTGGAHITDVRMTTRFKKDDLLEGLTGAIHETGHALYEQGRNLDYDGLPVSGALSMGVHESQSLLWERMVGLGRPFQHYLLPLLAERFPSKFGPGSSASAETLYEASNVIRVPSLIRVEADEVTYPLHIILRYEIERGLLDGTIKVADVPKVWNQKMSDYLGCTPPNDAKGCLQDIHWSGGALGYFPTYTLGAMMAAQIYAAAKKEIPGLEDKLSKGEFKPLKEWLNGKIHKLGSLYASGDELMAVATGAPLDPNIFLEYIKTKYDDLYKL